MLNLEQKNLMPKTGSSPLLEREDFQNLIDTGYFTVNGVMFSFYEDRWDISESISPEMRDEQYFSFDFSPISNEEAKVRIKLWTYYLLNPYKGSGTNKLSTINTKLAALIRCYVFMESKGWGYSFLQPKVYEAESYRAWLRKDVSYVRQWLCCSRYAKFLEFVEEVWKTPQDKDSMDVLTNFDAKKLKTTKKASVTESIPREFFQRLYGFCMKGMADGAMDINYRITCASIVLLSQTGLRRSEFYSLEAQPINKIQAEDKFGRTVEIKYVYANIRKSVRGSDTKFAKKKIPLTEDGEAAFNVLMDLCREKREEMAWNKLIVYPNKLQKTVHGTVIYDNEMLRLFARYHQELDCVNTQDKYPELAARRIGVLEGGVFDSLAEEFGGDAVIVYPTATHFRKTFATTLYIKGYSTEVISKLLHQQSPKTTENYYVRPYFNQKDFARSQETYNAIIKHDATVLGKSGADFKKRLQECLEEEGLASVCQSDEELIEQMSNLHPLHAKEVGFCLMSDIHPCTVRTDEERLMCAFNTCPNIGFLFYDLAEHYKQMETHKKAMELNRQQGFDLAAQKEANCMKYLAKTFLVPEIEETKLEIQKHGKEQIVEWYPAMKPILDAFEEIEAEVMAFVKEGVA